jgi:hypothetical protein
METAFSVADTARAMFIHYAMDMRSQCTAEVLSPEFFLYGEDEAPAIATYPIRCLGVVEVLGLLGVAIAQSEPDVSGAIETFVANFMAQQPGTRHPTSDRWAVSLLAPSIFLPHQIEVPCARRRTAGSR